MKFLYASHVLLQNAIILCWCRFNAFGRLRMNTSVELARIHVLNAFSTTNDRFSVTALPRDFFPSPKSFRICFFVLRVYLYRLFLSRLGHVHRAVDYVERFTVRGLCCVTYISCRYAFLVFQVRPKAERTRTIRILSEKCK